jgi:hypothetical protein
MLRFCSAAHRYQTLDRTAPKRPSTGSRQALKIQLFMAIYINRLQNMKNGQTAPDCPGNQYPAHALPRVHEAYLAQPERRDLFIIALKLTMSVPITNMW